MPKSTALIFGASSEIGTWIIDGLRDQGIYSVCLSRKALNRNIDFGDYDEILKLIKECQAKYKNIKSVYFCIGKYTCSQISESHPKSWISDVMVNLGYAYICYRSICDAFKNCSSEIRFVFLGSTASVSKPPEYSSYAVSKGGLEMLTTYINNEPPINIRACLLRLGTCKTNFSNSKSKSNVIRKEDVVQTVNYLENIGFHVFPDLVSLRPIRRATE